jgi:transposase-like protein
MWQITSQKNGISALGLQRVLGLGSYKTSWGMLHKLRRAMIRPGRDRLDGVLEVGGGAEVGAIGRLTESKTLVFVAAQEDGKGVGRIRLHTIPDLSRATLHGFIAEFIAPGSTVRTNGSPAYLGLKEYVHERHIQRHQGAEEHVLPRVYLVISQLKRWLLGTHQGAIGYGHLDDYLNEFTFRFNRRKSASRGQLFYRLAQQAVQIDPIPFVSLTKPQQVVLGGVK